MSVWMKGADVANAMKGSLTERAEALKSRGILPFLSIVRVGSRPDDLSYERGARKRMESIGIGCQVTELPEDISQEDFETAFVQLNEDPGVHGILLFRPLPPHLNEERILSLIRPEKDVDGMSPVNGAKVFCGDKTGYGPCTAEAVMEMLDYYHIDPKGKRVTVVGRSMVVGKPLSMMLLNRHATVTICHSHTKDLPSCCRQSEILVAAVGKAGMITGDMVKEQAVVVDVGINVDDNGNLCGDVDFAGAERKASYISPVPRGVGSITTSVLAKHVILAAERSLSSFI